MIERYIKKMLAVLFSIVLLMGCSAQNRKTTEQSVPQKPRGDISYGALNVESDAMGSIVAVRNGCVYGKNYEDDVAFLKYDIATGILTTIGRADMFQGAAKSSAAVNGNIYFCYGYDDTIRDFKVVLYELNTNLDALTKRGEMDSFSPLVYVSAGGDGFVHAVTSEKKGEIYKTKIIQFSPGQKSGSIIIEKECPLDFITGEKILACDTAEGGEIYLLTAQADNGEVAIRIEIYDVQGNFLRAIPLVGKEIEYILQQAVFQCSITDGVIFIQNFSSEMLLAQYTDTQWNLIAVGDIEFTLKRSTVSAVPESGMQVYYEPYAGRIWCLNPETTEIKIIEVSEIIGCDTVSKLSNVFIDEEDIFFEAEIAENGSRMYIYNLAQIYAETHGEMITAQNLPICLYE